MLPTADGPELESACEILSYLFDRRRPFYRHTGNAASATMSGVEGSELLSMVSEEEWRAGVGFADWVGMGGWLPERGAGGAWKMASTQKPVSFNSLSTPRWRSMDDCRFPNSNENDGDLINRSPVSFFKFK